MSRVVDESTLGRGPLGVIRKADRAGWYTVATVGSLDPLSLVIRGWQGGRRFVALYYSGAAAGAYWWTRERYAVIEGTRLVEHSTVATTTTRAVHDPARDESLSWTAEVAEPVPVSVTRLKELLVTQD